MREITPSLYATYESQLADRDQVQLELLGRKRYRWDIECEAHILTSSHSFY